MGDHVGQRSGSESGRCADGGAGTDRRTDERAGADPEQPGVPVRGGAPAPVFGYQPLWPFPTVSAATGWQLAYRAGGVQPWHLDPG